MPTKFNIHLGYKVQNQKLTKKLVIDLDGTNGIFIIGVPGSGKSSLITWLLTQLALKNVKIILAEYGAHSAKEGQTLIERTAHLHGSMIQKPMSYGNDITAMLRWLKQELVNRQNGSDTYPLVVVIDEFYQYASDEQEQKVTTKVTGNKRSAEGETKSTIKENNVFNEITTILTDARKNNIRFIFATQEPKASKSNSTALRVMRDLLGIVYLLKSSDNVSETMGVYDLDVRRRLLTVPKGFLYSIQDNAFVKIPNPVPQTYLDTIQSKYGDYVGYADVTQPQVIVKRETPVYDWTPEDEKLYMDAMFEYGPRINIWRLDTREDLIHNIIRSGQNKEFVKNNVKGNVNDNVKIAQKYIDAYDNTKK